MISLYQTIHDFIYGKSTGWITAVLFWPLSFFSLGYLLIVKLRNKLFDLGILKQTRLQAYVISVGNITAGGTGKTPWIVFLANLLTESGLRVVVLSRGYKANREGKLSVVSDGENILLPVEEAGDEPTLIARRCKGVPVILGSKRVISGKYAVDQLKAEVLLLDDGFQHRYLARDLDLINFNTRYGMGNGMLLPAGLLREPASSIARASAVTVHGEGERKILLTEYVKKNHPEISVFQSHLAYETLRSLRTGKAFSLKELQDKKVLAFCGIAIPEAMFEQLQDYQPSTLHPIPYPDHFQYTKPEIDTLQTLAREKSVDYIVTSEKDAMKIDPRWINDPGDLFYLEGNVQLDGGREKFERWLKDKLETK